MNKILILIAGIAIVACSSESTKDNPVLLEAQKVHLEAEAIQEQIEPEIMTLDSLKSLLLAQKSAEADSLASALTGIKAEYDTWEKNFFEVPGFEHTHKEGHEHHDHDHSPAPELPADKMLDVQKEIKTTLVHIQKNLEDILAKTKENLKKQSL